MKKIICLGLCAALLGATQLVIKESPDRTVIYEKAPAPASAKSLSPQSRGTRYLINGDPLQVRESTGRLIIGFENEIDAQGFAARWHLANPRRISRMFVTWAFDNASAIDDAALAAQIGAQEPGIRFAKPEWMTQRTHK